MISQQMVHNSMLPIQPREKIVIYWTICEKILIKKQKLYALRWTLSLMHAGFAKNIVQATKLQIQCGLTMKMYSTLK